MQFVRLFVGSSLAALALSGCGSAPNPFASVPACVGPEITPLEGSRQLVMSSLKIADFGEGFDLDGDKVPDNKLALLGPLANPSLMPEFQTGFQVMIGVELYGYDGKDSSCVKSAMFLGAFNKDRDGDKKTTTWDKGDCLDTDANVAPNKPEVMGNRLDDDCDGFADNMTKGSKPDDMTDADGDGYSPNQGDCDDRADATNLALAKSRHPGATDTCADGIDQDCDGIPDNAMLCFPFADNAATLDLSELSFVDQDRSNAPYIEFSNGTIKNGEFNGGPALFAINIPFFGGINFELKLSATRLSMTLEDDSAKMQSKATAGTLGGVLDAVTLASVTGIDGEGIIREDQTLLDALFAGQLAGVLGLDVDIDNHYLPDMDVDRDGLESFWEEEGAEKKVDTCRDGDGTIVRNDFDGKGTPCWLAKDAKGNYRFADGISIALKFTAVPVKFGEIIAGPPATQ